MNEDSILDLNSHQSKKQQRFILNVFEETETLLTVSKKLCYEIYGHYHSIEYEIMFCLDL